MDKEVRETKSIIFIKLRISIRRQKYKKEKNRNFRVIE